MVKVGDRVKLVKEYGAWCSDNVGKEGTVMGRAPDGFVTVVFDASEGEAYEKDWGNPDHLELISTTPTYSIPADTETVTLKYADGSTQDIDVKDRARGVPEWVKDGQWVVNKISGVIARLSTESVGFNVRYLTGMSYNFSASDVHERFRPFTNSDWKWGMWAEYRGEKVFVCSGELPFDLIRIDANPDGKIHTTLGSNGYVNIDQLIPTTAP